MAENHQGIVALASIAFAVFSLPTAAAAQDMPDLARCALKKDREAAVALVRRLPLGSQATDVKAIDLGEAASCMETSVMTVPAIELRGAFAQTLFMADFREVGLRPHRAPRDFANLELPDMSDASTATLPELPLYRLADCVARSDARDVEQYLKATPDSRMEREWFARLQPYMAACAKDQRITMSAATWRGALAQTAYFASARYWDGQLSSYTVR